MAVACVLLLVAGAPADAAVVVVAVAYRMLLLELCRRGVA